MSMLGGLGASAYGSSVGPAISNFRQAFADFTANQRWQEEMEERRRERKRAEEEQKKAKKKAKGDTLKAIGIGAGAAALTAGAGALLAAPAAAGAAAAGTGAAAAIPGSAGTMALGSGLSTGATVGGAGATGLAAGGGAGVGAGVGGALGGVAPSFVQGPAAPRQPPAAGQPPTPQAQPAAPTSRWKNALGAAAEGGLYGAMASTPYTAPAAGLMYANSPRLNPRLRLAQDWNQSRIGLTDARKNRVETLLPGEVAQLGASAQRYGALAGRYGEEAETIRAARPGDVAYRAGQARERGTAADLNVARGKTVDARRFGQVAGDWAGAGRSYAGAQASLAGADRTRATARDEADLAPFKLRTAEAGARTAERKADAPLNAPSDEFSRLLAQSSLSPEAKQEIIDARLRKLSGTGPVAISDSARADVLKFIKSNTKSDIQSAAAMQELMEIAGLPTEGAIQDQAVVELEQRLDYAHSQGADRGYAEGAVWDYYNQGKISESVRDELLRKLREGGG